MSNFADTITSDAYQHWIYQQEEPESGLITGNAKRYTELPVTMRPPDKFDLMTEREKDEANDEHLKRYSL